MFDNEKYRTCIQFFYDNKLDKIKHSNSTFFNHLVGTYNILRTWQQSEDLCLAGLFHSIYGTEFFKHDIVFQRETIKKLIGEKAENIAYQFCNIPRSSIIDSGVKDLIILSIANDLEQKKLFKVYDNLFNQENLEKIYEHFVKNCKWEFGNNLTEASLKWKYNPTFDSDIEKLILNNQENILKNTGLNHIVKLHKCYVSANQYGHFGEFHYDEDAAEYNNWFTLMYYLNKQWNLDFAGETVFLNEKEDDIFTSIIPKPGRAILFDGFIKHASRPLNKIFSGVRLVLTFKYKIK